MNVLLPFFEVVSVLLGKESMADGGGRVSMSMNMKPGDQSNGV
jgi:hypothetical protein